MPPQLNLESEDLPDLFGRTAPPIPAGTLSYHSSSFSFPNHYTLFSPPHLFFNRGSLLVFPMSDKKVKPLGRNVIILFLMAVFILLATSTAISGKIRSNALGHYNVLITETLGQLIYFVAYTLIFLIQRKNISKEARDYCWSFRFEIWILFNSP
jgi:hypothetical protein